MLGKLQNPKILLPTALILLLTGISVGFIIGLSSSGSTPERYIALDSGGAIIAGDQGNVWAQAGTGKQTLATPFLPDAKNYADDAAAAAPVELSDLPPKVVSRGFARLSHGCLLFCLHTSGRVLA